MFCGLSNHILKFILITYPQCFMFCGLSILTAILILRSSWQFLVVCMRYHSGWRLLLAVTGITTYREFTHSTSHNHYMYINWYDMQGTLYLHISLSSDCLISNSSQFKSSINHLVRYTWNGKFSIYWTGHICIIIISYLMPVSIYFFFPLTLKIRFHFINNK